MATTVSPRRCPICETWNEPVAERCDCGYNFGRSDATVGQVVGRTMMVRGGLTAAIAAVTLFLTGADLLARFCLILIVGGVSAFLLGFSRWRLWRR